jgi:hypothetical protein
MGLLNSAKNVERAYSTLENLLTRYEDKLEDDYLLDKLEYVLSLLEEALD